MISNEKHLNSEESYEYEKILEEEIISSYEDKSKIELDINEKNKKYYRFKRSAIEILNRLLFLIFIGSFTFSFFLFFIESRIWFILYFASACSCIFYTPNRKAVKELIAAWPNLEDILKGRSLWRKDR